MALFTCQQDISTRALTSRLLDGFDFLEELFEKEYHPLRKQQHECSEHFHA